MTDQQDETVPETTGRRLCGYSGCRAPLPISSGPGNRPRYCQDGRTWGDRNVTCKQAGHAEELLASINAPAQPAPTAAAELTERIDVLLDPTRALVSALESVREQLESQVAAATHERDQALRAAAEERGQREIADDRAAAAGRRAQECVQEAELARAERDTADSRADEADERRQQAEHARLRAEARADELAEQVRRTDERLQAAVGYAEDVDRKLAAATTRISELRSRLDEERQRSEAERTRAEQLVAEHQRQLEAERTRAADRLEQVRLDHERERATLAERHEATVGELRERLGQQQQRLADERDRSEGSRRQLDEWRQRLRELIEAAGRSPEREPADQVADEVNDTTTAERDGVESAADRAEIELVESDLISALQALLKPDTR